MPGPGETQFAEEFTMSGIEYTPVEDIAESGGGWGNPFVAEWRHWITGVPPA